MNSCSNVDAKRPNGLDDRLPASHRAGWSIERCEEAVTSSVDLDASKANKQSADNGMMSFDELAPPTVAKRGRSLGGTDEISEEDRREHSVEIGFLAVDRRYEPTSRCQNFAGVSGERRMLLASKFDDLGIRHLVSDVPRLLDTLYCVVNSVHDERRDGHCRKHRSNVGLTLRSFDRQCRSGRR